MFKKNGIKLNLLISLLILFVVISSTSINWIVSMNTYKKSLSENQLEHNYSYVKKLTSSTEYQLNYMLKNIIVISETIGSHDINQDDVDAWFNANESQFNSLFITDANGVVQYVNVEEAIRSEVEKVEPGLQLTSDMFKSVLKEKKPSISNPYYGTTNQLLTLISAPIYDAKTHEFEGIVGGTIYMEKGNVLRNLLANHSYEDHTYVFVIDESGRLIYHPDETRLWEDVSSNKMVQRVMNKEEGSMIIKNTQGKEHFAGYAFVESTGWGIIAQTPTSILEETTKKSFSRIAMISLPFIFGLLIIGGLLVKAITKPIGDLVLLSKQTVHKQSVENKEHINITSPIYEVRELYQQVLAHFRILNRQARIDGLTQIANRSTFDSTINSWLNEGKIFSLIMIDVDFFKKVNDTHGHLIGDEVLKFLAREMTDITDTEDMCFRYGGEEFAILAKEKDTANAYVLAESLRKHIENKASPTGEPIHISLGVTTIQDKDTHAETLISRADAALYHSKKNGRNQTNICNDNQLEITSYK